MLQIIRIFAFNIFCYLLFKYLKTIHLVILCDITFIRLTEINHANMSFNGFNDRCTTFSKPNQ